MVKTPCFHCRGHGFDPWSLVGELRSCKPRGEPCLPPPPHPAIKEAIIKNNVQLNFDNGNRAKEMSRR